MELFDIVYESENGVSLATTPFFAHSQFKQIRSVSTFGSVYLRSDNTRPLCENGPLNAGNFPRTSSKGFHHICRTDAMNIFHFPTLCKYFFNYRTIFALVTKRRKLHS